MTWSHRSVCTPYRTHARAARYRLRTASRSAKTQQGNYQCRPQLHGVPPPFKGLLGCFQLMKSLKCFPNRVLSSTCKRVRRGAAPIGLPCSSSQRFLVYYDPLKMEFYPPVEIVVACRGQPLLQAPFNSNIYQPLWSQECGLYCIRFLYSKLTQCERDASD